MMFAILRHYGIPSKIVNAIRVLYDNSKEDQTRNDELYKLVHQKPVSETIRERQLRFIGQCLRMHPDEPSNIYALYTSQIKGQGLVGRPKASYLDQIARHLCSDKEIKFGLTQIKTWAMDTPTFSRA